MWSAYFSDPARNGGDLARLLEWSRFPGDVVFIVFGVVPITIAAVRAWLGSRRAALLAAPVLA